MLDSPSPSPSNIVGLTDLLERAIQWILKRDKQYDVRLNYARGNRELAEEFLRHAQAELGMTATTLPAKKSHKVEPRTGAPASRAGEVNDPNVGLASDSRDHTEGTQTTVSGEVQEGLDVRQGFRDGTDDEDRLLMTDFSLGHLPRTITAKTNAEDVVVKYKSNWYKLRCSEDSCSPYQQDAYKWLAEHCEKMHGAKFSPETSKVDVLRKYGCWIRNAPTLWRKPFGGKKARCRASAATAEQEPPSGTVKYSLEFGQLSKRTNDAKILSAGSDELAEGSYPAQEDEEDGGIENREEADDVVEEEEEDFEAAMDEDYVVPSNDPADSDYAPGDDQDSGIESEIPGPLHDFTNYDGFDRTHTTRRRRLDEANAIRKEKRDKNWADLAFLGSDTETSDEGDVEGDNTDTATTINPSTINEAQDADTAETTSLRSSSSPTADKLESDFDDAEAIEAKRMRRIEVEAMMED